MEEKMCRRKKSIDNLNAHGNEDVRKMNVDIINVLPDDELPIFIKENVR